MGTVELKNIINQYTSEIGDDAVLLKVKALYESYLKKHKGVVAYSIEGTPLTVSEYREEIQKGIDDISSGRVITDSDLEKEIETW